MNVYLVVVEVFEFGSEGEHTGKSELHNEHVTAANIWQVVDAYREYEMDAGLDVVKIEQCVPICREIKQ